MLVSKLIGELDTDAGNSEMEAGLPITFRYLAINPISLKMLGTGILSAMACYRQLSQCSVGLLRASALM